MRRIKFFQAKSHPATLRKGALPAKRRRPERVPEGQTHLQNQGEPCPIKSTAKMGRRITKTIRTRYLKKERIFSPGRRFSFLGKGIL